MLIKLVGVFVLAGIIYASTRDWRKSINSVFFIIVFEGVLRKWVLPQASDLIYFLKDIILLGAYWKYFFASPNEPKYRVTNNWINLLIFLSFAMALMQLFNPSLGSPIVGLIGLKAYFIYIPLIWILPSMFRTENDLIWFLRWNLLLVLIVGWVSCMQYFSPADSWINSYAPGDVETIAVTRSGSVRITGTFSFINSFQGYLIGVFALALPLAFIPQSVFWQLLTFTELGLIMGCSFMTGSRTPVYTEAFVAMGYFASIFITQPSRFIKWINNLIVPTVLATPIIIKVFDKAIESFTNRVNTTHDFSSRVNNTIGEPIHYSTIREGSGYGIGATHPGSRVIKTKFNVTGAEQITLPNEAEPGKVMLELGPYGFLVWYGLRVSIILTLSLRYFQLKRPLLKNLVLTGMLIQLIQLPGQVVFHHTFGLYYWLFSSFIFVFPQIELWEEYFEQQSAQQHIFIGDKEISLADYQPPNT